MKTLVGFMLLNLSFDLPAAPPDITLTNPILTGFHPDPSICRVAGDYYVVHSSFEYFSGVPISPSGDLVNGHQIGHVRTPKSQLNLDKMCSSSRSPLAMASAALRRPILADSNTSRGHNEPAP